MRPMAHKESLAERLVDAILNDNSAINVAARVVMIVAIATLILMVVMKFGSGAW